MCTHIFVVSTILLWILMKPLFTSWARNSFMCFLGNIPPFKSKWPLIHKMLLDESFCGIWMSLVWISQSRILPSYLSWGKHLSPLYKCVSLAKEKQFMFFWRLTGVIGFLTIIYLTLIKSGISMWILGELSVSPLIIISLPKHSTDRSVKRCRWGIHVTYFLKKNFQECFSFSK